MSLPPASEPRGRALAILGAGVMGETVLSGLLRAGWAPAEIVATDRRPERRAELTQTYGIRMLENSEGAARSPRTAIVSVAASVSDSSASASWRRTCVAHTST